MVKDDSSGEPIDIAGDVAHPARVYDYVRGGNDNFAVDRETADFAVAGIAGELDHARMAVRANQAFLARAVTFLAADAGIRQFLEIGTSIPSAEPTHVKVQRIAPACRVAYVNDDPVVLAHAHTLRKSTAEGAASYIDADPRDPAEIIAKAQPTLDLNEPVGVVLVAVLHHVCDSDDPHGIVDQFMDAVPAGSHLVISHLTNEIIEDAVTEAARRINEQPGFTLILRTHEQIGRFFAKLDLVPPGLVPVDRWHAPGAPPPTPEPLPTPFYGAVGRKP